MGACNLHHFMIRGGRQTMQVRDMPRLRTADRTPSSKWVANPCRSTYLDDGGQKTVVDLVIERMG